MGHVQAFQLTRQSSPKAVAHKEPFRDVAKPNLCETEVRASQSEPICLSRARGRRVACLKVRALGNGANSHRYAAQRLRSSPINLTGNARSVEVGSPNPRKSRSGRFRRWRDLSVAHVPQAGFGTAKRVGFADNPVLDQLGTSWPVYVSNHRRNHLLQAQWALARPSFG